MLASHLASTRRHCWTRPRSLASLALLLLTAICGLGFLGIPNLLRLRLRLGLSSYDYGFHGIYPTRHYHSVGYDSPAVEHLRWDEQCSDDYVFIEPHGDAVKHPASMILDSRGNLVWRMIYPTGARDIRVQGYKGDKYLTYWHEPGSWSLLDSSYRHRYEVVPVGQLEGNMHDIRITENGTAVVMMYDTIPADLSAYGGPKNGYVTDGLFQEIDIADGSLVFEWRMSDHVPINATNYDYRGTGWSSEDSYDAYHLNSIDKDQFGNYLLSSRHTNSIYCIDGKTGEIIWTLGGQWNDFTDASGGHALNFAWQHDARWHGDHTLSFLDNHAEWFLDDASLRSRAVILDLDIANRTARLKKAYHHPDGIRATSQGNMQILPDSGNVFVGWGHCAAFTEFAADGTALCDSHFGPSNAFELGQVVSYRTTRGKWVGRPDTLPVTALVGSSAFVSWNGATEVAAWRLERWNGSSSAGEKEFSPVKVVKKDGFETEIELPQGRSSNYYRIVALDKKHHFLAATELFGSEESNRSFGHLVKTFTNLFSFPELFSMVLLLLSFLMGIFWAWKFCARRVRSHRYRLVPLDAEDSPSGEVPLSPVSSGDSQHGDTV